MPKPAADADRFDRAHPGRLLWPDCLCAHPSFFGRGIAAARDFDNKTRRLFQPPSFPSFCTDCLRLRTRGRPIATRAFRDAPRCCACAHAAKALTLRNYYPNHLIERPSHAELPRTDIRCGDMVTLHPNNGQAPITSVVKVVVTLFGCITYTSESLPAADDRQSDDRAVLRFRFRQQDVHHVERARPCGLAMA